MRRPLRRIRSPARCRSVLRRPKHTKTGPQRIGEWASLSCQGPPPRVLKAVLRSSGADGRNITPHDVRPLGRGSCRGGARSPYEKESPSSAPAGPRAATGSRLGADLPELGLPGRTGGPRPGPAMALHAVAWRTPPPLARGTPTALRINAGQQRRRGWIAAGGSPPDGFNRRVAAFERRRIRPNPRASPALTCGRPGRIAGRLGPRVRCGREDRRPAVPAPEAALREAVVGCDCSACPRRNTALRHPRDVRSSPHRHGQSMAAARESPRNTLARARGVRAVERPWVRGSAARHPMRGPAAPRLTLPVTDESSTIGPDSDDRSSADRRITAKHGWAWHGHVRSSRSRRSGLPRTRAVNRLGPPRVTRP